MDILVLELAPLQHASHFVGCKGTKQKDANFWDINLKAM